MILSTAGLATHIMNNQLKSVILLMGFPFLLLLMTAGFFACWHALGAGGAAQGVDWGRAVEAGYADMLRYSPVVIGVTAVWFTIAWFFHGAMISAASGAKPVTRQQMPKIYNMLENLCISRGIPMPKFEVIDSPALNAFASGINQKTYKIVLTRGIIEALQDDELEAVIAHELAHILNRDVRLLIISVIFVGMISFFAEMAFRTLVHSRRPNYYSRGRGGKEGGGAIIILLIAVAILFIGYLFAVVIRFALSRKREFMADAGAVELTRNPEAMMRALMRISGHDKIKGMPDELQQMCIENSNRFMGMFATHPPIPARIEAISRHTATPVPSLPVSLRRPPSRPWDGGAPPSAGQAPPQRPPIGGSLPGRNPWGA